MMTSTMNPKKEISSCFKFQVALRVPVVGLVLAVSVSVTAWLVASNIPTKALRQ